MQGSGRVVRVGVGGDPRRSRGEAVLFVAGWHGAREAFPVDEDGLRCSLEEAGGVEAGGERVWLPAVSWVAVGDREPLLLLPYELPEWWSQGSGSERWLSAGR